MEKYQDISIQRIALKQEITELIEANFAAKILQASGSLIQKLSKQTSPLPWYAKAFILEILGILPPLFFALILRQPEQLVGNGLIWITSNLIVMPSIPIIYFAARYILIIVRDHILDNIEDKCDLDNLQSFLSKIGDHQKIFFYAFNLSLLWSIFAISIFSLFMGRFIGPSSSFAVWLWGFVALGMGSFFVFWLMRFPGQIENYHYKLYKLDPSKSEVILYLSILLRRPFWMITLYIALGTFTAGVFKIFGWVILVMIVVFWVPLIVQFVNSLAAINKIVAAQKWQTLNDIQRQIQKRQREIELNFSESIESVNKLMDLHERVYNTSNLRLSLTSLATFLSQLLLPVLAFIFSNLDTIAELLK